MLCTDNNPPSYQKMMPKINMLFIKRELQPVKGVLTSHFEFIQQLYNCQCLPSLCLYALMKWFPHEGHHEAKAVSLGSLYF